MVARHRGIDLHLRDGVSPAIARARVDRGRLRGAVDPVGAHRPGCVPVPLLHSPPVRGPRAGPPSRRIVAPTLETNLDVGPDRRAGRDHRTRGDVALLTATV